MLIYLLNQALQSHQNHLFINNQGFALTKDLYQFQIVELEKPGVEHLHQS